MIRSLNVERSIVEINANNQLMSGLTQTYDLDIWNFENIWNICGFLPKLQFGCHSVLNTDYEMIASKIPASKIPVLYRIFTHKCKLE